MLMGVAFFLGSYDKIGTFVNGANNTPTVCQNDFKFVS